MEFVFDTTYNQKAITTMAKTLRKTIRKKSSRRSYIFGWTLVVLSLLSTLPFGNKELVISFTTIIAWISALIISLILLFEDKMNGYIAKKQMLAGTDRAVSTFNVDTYHSTSDVGRTDFPYENIYLIAECGDYFVFVLDKNHAQLYDKNTISGGTVDAFRQFISSKTGKVIQQVK